MERGVTLRPITYQDTDLIIKWRNDEEVRKRFFFREEFTREMHENWMKTKVEPGKVIQFIVELDGQPVGSTYVQLEEDGVGEYGMFLGEEYARGKGIGKKILSITLDYCWKKLELHKVYSRIMADNPASVKSLLNVGFQITENKKEVACSDGELKDMYILSIDNPSGEKSLKEYGEK